MVRPRSMLLALLLVTIMLLSSQGLSARAASSSGIALPSELALVELGPFAQSDVGTTISALQMPVVETYNSSVLTYVNNDTISMLESRGFIVKTIPNATVTGRGAFLFDTRNGEPKIPEDLRVNLSLTPNYDKYIVQLVGPVKPEWIQLLNANGVEILGYLPCFSFIVAAPQESLIQVGKLSFVKWIGLYQPAYKISPELLSLGDGSLDLKILLFSGAQNGSIVKLIDEAGGTILSTSNDLEGAGHIVANLSGRLIPQLAQQREVIWIERRGNASLCNDQATWVIQDYPHPEWRRVSVDHSLAGQGQIITIADTGLNTAHESFLAPSKIVDYQDIPPYGDDQDNAIQGYEGHGTHIAGTAIGNHAPYDSYTETEYDGHAYEAGLIVQDFADDFHAPPPDDLINWCYAPSYTLGSNIHSDSWGFNGNNYNDWCYQTDQFMWFNPHYLVFFSAGNNGPSGGTLQDTANAKDIVTVGATYNNKLGYDGGTLWSGSSRGPAHDGRLKPTVCAPGVNIESADFQNIAGYTVKSGTSMATPAVAGSAAMIRQYFLNGYYPVGAPVAGNSMDPSAALVKAVLVNSGSDCTGGVAGPDNAEGWGHVVLDDALYFSGDARRMDVVDYAAGLGATTDYKMYSVRVVDSSQPLKITLVWTDYPGQIAGPKELINDLDLDVWDPAGVHYLGNVFNGHSESQIGGASDRLNVEECVIRTNPSVGQWTIKVNAVVIAHGPQPFALVSTGTLDPMILREDFTNWAPGGTSAWETVATGGSVSRDDTTGNVSAPSLKLIKSSSSGQTSARHNFDRLVGNIVVQAKVKVNTNAAGKPWLYFMLMNGGYVLHFALRGGSFCYYDGLGADGGWNAIGLTYQANKWYVLTFDVHLGQGTFDILVDYGTGNYRFNGANFYDHLHNAHVVTYIQFQDGYSSQNGLTAWVDDVSIRSGSLLFEDGFQDGDYAGWSNPVVSGQNSIGIVTGTGLWSPPCLYLNRCDLGNCYIRHTFANQNVRVIVQAYLATEFINSQRFYFMLGGDAGYVTYMWVAIYQTGIDHLYYYDGGTHDTRFVIQDKHWHLVTVDAHLQSGTYDVFIDNTLALFGAYFGDGVLGQHTVNFLHIQAGYDSQGVVHGWVDDVLLTTT